MTQSGKLQIGSWNVERVPEGRLLPPQAFTDPAVYEHELDRVFGRSWVHVADLTDLEQPGDFVTADVGRSPVVVVRGHDGALRGFFNVCSHRAATVADGKGNCGRRLVCPYHAWSYSTDGRLLSVPDKQEFTASLEGLDLRPVRVATMGPMVFACTDESTPDFDAWTGSQGRDWERTRPERYHLSCELEYEVAANWKLYVENGLEGYHVQYVHDFLNDLVATKNAKHSFHRGGSHTHAMVNEGYRDMLGEDAPLVNENGPYIQFGFVFPNLIPVVGAFASYLRVDPAGPDRLKLRFRAFDSGDERALSLREFTRESTHRTNEQDIGVVERVQRGMHAKGYPGGLHASFLEVRIRHFEDLYVDHLLANA